MSSQEDKRAANRARKIMAAEAFQGKLDQLASKVEGGELAGSVKEILVAWDDLKARFPVLRDMDSIGDRLDTVTTSKAASASSAVSKAPEASAASSNKASDESKDNVSNAPVAETKEAEPVVPKVEYVTRYEIREMSKAQQDRFFDAIDKMMENKDGVPGTSEFFRCASYHGNPPPIYCKHGRETFPGWHRIYLLDFEKAIQAADRALGNDGNIGLPYWDWTVRPEDGLPSIIRERFSEWPKDLFPKDIGEKPSLSRNDDATISSMIESWGVIQTARDCLLSVQHFAHASTGGEWASNYPSVEAPHNYMHVIVGGRGGVMGAVAWAAFDIAFWLHHCNVDRIYETYIQMEPDSKDEFEWTQKQQGGDDLYNEPFEPFKNSEGKPYYPGDTFDVKKLGFIYNTPFPAPNMHQLRMAPTVAMFSNVKVNEFESKCYQIHLFVLNKKSQNKFNEPKTISDIDFTSKNYAGGSGVFGRGTECENCATRPPYDIFIDISKTLTKLKLSRYDAQLKVYCMETTDTSGNLIQLKDTPLPEPIVTGPLFENTEDSLTQKDKDSQNSEEVRALQRYLKRFGYYDDELDGSYGPITEKAVKIYQQATGTLKIDGLAGKNTKKSIRDLRRCDNKDGFGENKVEDERVHDGDDSGAKMYDGKTRIKYNIGVCPGYLSRKAVQECFNKAFNLWSDATNNNIKFEELPALGDEAKSDIYFSWSTGANKNNSFMKFDGVGGVLGLGGLKNDKSKGFVVFDIAERWVIGFKTQYNRHEMKPSNINDTSTWYRGQPTISLFYTAVHEIGHALGLDHSINARDWMSPFYDPNKQSLSNNDVKRIKQSFGLK